MLKLSRVGHVRDRALDVIDAHYAARINAILGPMAVVHLLKRVAPAGELVPDKEAILERAAEQDAEIAAVERERLDLKAKVRSASTSEAVKALIAHL